MQSPVSDSRTLTSGDASMMPIGDPARLEALREAGLMEAGTEEALERLARMAATLLRTPLAQVNFIDDERQFSKSCFAPADWPGGRDTSLEDSFCKHTVISGEALIIEDARTHPLVARSAAIGMGVIAYAGIPLTMSDGHTFGTLCVVAFEPRRWTDEEILTLRDLAASVVTEIELRREIARGERVHGALKQQASVLELAHDCIIVRDLDGTIRFWNGGAERVYGWSRDHAIGASSHQLLGTRGPKPIAEIEQEMLRDGLWDGELVHQTRDGSEITVESRWAIQCDEDGAARAVLEINRDISSRKRAEERLIAKRDLLDLLHVAAVAANRATTLEEVTQEVIRHVCTRTQFILGHAYIANADSGDLVATRVWCRAEGERFQTFRSTTESMRFEPGVGIPGRVLASGEAVWIPEVSEHPDFTRAGAASECGLHSAATIPVLVGDEIVAVLEFFADAPLPPDPILLEALENVGTQIGRVVERVRSQAAHIAARRAAEVANSAKSEFLSRMSHELRTPMNAILGFAQLLELDHLSAEQHESVDQILKGGRHLLALINEVLDIARIEAGRMALSPEPVQVREVLQEVLGLVWPLARDREIALPKAIPEPCERYVRADRQRLKQVLLNLFSNAIKYNRQRGSVEISCGVFGDRLRVSVSDTGPGIPAEKRAQLFKPFERLGAEQNGLEGTGLGLALSKALIEAMQGEIGVETEPGQGSTFWVELPTAEAELERYELEGGGNIAQTEKSPSATARTVLHIEDNLSNLRLIERILASQPEINVIPAALGRLGLELAAEHGPDLILLDVNLPDLDGEEVLLRLQADARTAGTPVIVLSADATPGQVRRFLMTGARAYLTKPIDVKQFLELTNEVLSSAGIEG